MLPPVLPLRNPLYPLAVCLALAASACEIVADFDRDKINQSTVAAPGDLPKIPAVPAERPQPAHDAGPLDAGLDDAGVSMDAGDSDGGTDADAALDADTDGGDASAPDAGMDAASGAEI